MKLKSLTIEEYINRFQDYAGSMSMAELQRYSRVVIHKTTTYAYVGGSDIRLLSQIIPIDRMGTVSLYCAGLSESLRG